MLSIAELAHKRDPKAIAEIICQELQPLDIEKLGVDVDIVDSSLEIQIRTDSAIDKEKLLTLVHSKLQNLHIESVAKFRIHCWRNDQEIQQQRLLWTEQFMLDLPKSSLTASSLTALPDIDPALDRPRPEMRSPEPQLSKHSVLQNAIKKIAPNNPQAKKHLLASDLAPQALANGSTISSTDLARINRPQPQSDSNYWQLFFVGLSIVLLGLGIGASVKAITSKTSIESSSSSPLAPRAVENKEAKNTTTTTKRIPSQTIQPSVANTQTNTQTTTKANPALVDAIANPNEQEQEQVITLEKFNRIQKGMTIEQVDKVFGTSGKVIAENNSSNSIGQVYSWKNPQGSNAIIEFKDGQVVAKAQAGL
jgi:hypothetical protein